MDAYQDLLNGLLKELYSQHNVEPQDKVRTVFQHPELHTRAFSTTMVKAGDLTNNFIMNPVERVMQSGDTYHFSENMLRYFNVLLIIAQVTLAYSAGTRLLC